MSLDVPDRDEWFPAPHGHPRPDWLTISQWILNVVLSDDRFEAAEQITRYWLARLAAALGPPHSVFESEHFFIVSTQDKSERLRKLEFLDRAREHVLQALGKAAGIYRSRKLVILRLTNMDDVYEVYTDMDSDRAAASAFFGSSASPVIYCEHRRPSAEYRPLSRGVVYHLLSHLQLPSWLYYSLGEALEVDLVGGRFAVLDEEMLEMHRRSWNARSIQDFWSGKFLLDREWQGLSCNLADLLLDMIRRELRPDFSKVQRFIQEAARKDAGEAAALRFFGVGLGEIVNILLGDGDWSPKPSTWETREERG